MCILILGAAVAKILSVALSSHACRERVGGNRDHWRPRVRGVQGGDPHTGGGSRATTD